MIAAALLLAMSAPAPAADPAAMAFFEKEIRPLLVARCHGCHSKDKGKRKGGLLLDSRAGWIEGGESGPAVVPGAPDESLLVKAVRYKDAALEMPPDGPLPAKEVALLERWVKMGAPDPRVAAPPVAAAAAAKDVRPHWAFTPLAPPAIPSVRDRSWPRTDVDRFILAAQESRGLTPSPPAAAARLIRRATLVVTGLPPTPDEVRAFVRDRSPRAYERLVDRLLASPRFGERWARHWLDVARFGESDGFEQDSDRTFAYPYRDFVVRAFNRDLPYDRFVAWQIAGDELAPADPWAVAATGFLGAGPFPTQLTEAEFESARYDEIDDMVSAVGTAFLGLTVGCARCHDHKFDPIAAQDYYRLAATFTTTIRTRMDLPLGAEAHRIARGGWTEALARLRAEAAKVTGDPARTKSLAKQIDKHLAAQPGKGLTPVMVSSEGRKPLPHLADERGFPHFYPQFFQLRRGDVRQKMGIASPGMLPVLLSGDERLWRTTPPQGARTTHRRHALARWLVDTDTGAGRLVARVMVNRLWQHHLGRPLVATPNDFGRQGAAPTHPALLDHLASELVAGGWRLKRIHRLILTSATFRQAATARPEARAIDPDEVTWWRWQPRRLEAEAIRDSMLAVAGVLDGRMAGPGTLDEDSRRRSLYFTIKRSKLIPAMQLFDAPDALGSMGRRDTTTVAPQALLLMNSPQVRAWATAFAGQVRAPVRRAPAEAVLAAHWLALGRAPDADESRDALAFLEAQASSYDNVDRALVDLCQALFAHSEFITVE